MADDLNPAIIKKTQETLGKYVKKPNLTEKLLKKPPFRFLHDVFSVVIKDTGCFAGLYSTEELTYENIKDRDDKMKFLQKMIDVVKLTTGSSLAVRTSKIVAGHEPEKTNELLQLIGEIIEKKLNWKTAVEQVLTGKTPRKESPRKSKDSLTKPTKDTKPKDKSKDKPKEKDTKIKDSKTTKNSTNKTAATANKDEKLKVNKTKDKVSTKPKEKNPKATKEPDKPLKKSTKESSNNKAKLTKTESQTSNKSSPTPTKLEPKESPVTKSNETECNHDEKVEITQSIEKNMEDNSNRKLSSGSVHNEISIFNETVALTNQQDPLQLNQLDAEVIEKPKKSSAKSRKSSGRNKLAESFGEKVDEKINLNTSDIANNYQAQEKSETSEAIASELLTKQETLPHYINQQQPQLDKQNMEKTNSPPPKIPSQPTPTKKQPSPPVSLTNEIKRESTFTRENSKESSSNQSSLAHRPRTSLRPPSARPPSARPGAPRRRDKNIEIILQPNDQLKMSGIQVKLETFGDLDDDGDNLVIIENPNTTDVINDQQTNLTESEKLMQDDTLEQGHLVQQILETQKELVQQPNDNQQKSNKDSTNGLVLRQTSARHMNNLRDVIQNLTKSINPLGKLMDFIPEDIDAMQLEFTMWRDAYTQAANELKREKSLTESATEPMKNQLIQIEANIQEYMEMIDASRVKILQNSEKILKMLTTS